MRTSHLPQTLQLTHGECFAARGPKLRLTVISGRLWFTRSGDPLDRFFDAGTSCVLGDAGALVSAEGPTRVRVERVRRARLAWPSLWRAARVQAAGKARAPGGIIDRCPNAAMS